jgi:hypothetical protein
VVLQATGRCSDVTRVVMFIVGGVLVLVRTHSEAVALVVPGDFN